MTAVHPTLNIVPVLLKTGRGAPQDLMVLEIEPTHTLGTVARFVYESIMGAYLEDQPFRIEFKMGSHLVNPSLVVPFDLLNPAIENVQIRDLHYLLGNMKSFSQREYEQLRLNAIEIEPIGLVKFSEMIPDDHFRQSDQYKRPWIYYRDSITPPAGFYSGFGTRHT